MFQSIVTYWSGKTETKCISLPVMPCIPQLNIWGNFPYDQLYDNKLGFDYIIILKKNTFTFRIYECHMLLTLRYRLCSMVFIITNFIKCQSYLTEEKSVTSLPYKQI